MLDETEAIARKRADCLNNLIDPELNLAAGSSNVGADLTRLKPATVADRLQELLEAGCLQRLRGDTHDIPWHVRAVLP